MNNNKNEQHNDDMTQLSGAEFTLFLMMVFIGAAGNLVLYFSGARMTKQKRWAFYGYGSAMVVLMCGWLTPPDLLSTFLFSVPLVVALPVFARRLNIYFKLNHTLKTKKNE